MKPLSAKVFHIMFDSDLRKYSMKASDFYSCLIFSWEFQLIPVLIFNDIYYYICITGNMPVHPGLNYRHCFIFEAMYETFDFDF